MNLVLLVQLCLYLTVSAQEATEIDAASSCTQHYAASDIAILLDSTGSITRENWDGVKDLVKNVADRINYRHTRIATIRYSRKASKVIGLQDFYRKQNMFDALDAVEYKPGGGQVHKALNLLQDTFSEGRQNIARIGVLVIDEKSHNTPAALAAAEKVKQAGIKMIVIGVKRRRFDMDELVGISSGKSRVILIDDIRDLNKPEVLDKLMGLICEADATWDTWSEWSTCNATCGQDVTRARTRVCYQGFDYRNPLCEGDAEETENCGLEPCQTLLPGHMEDSE